MENATKALYIAAGVLIGILILSLGVNLYFTFSQYAKVTQEEIQRTNIATFNETFLKYQGKKDITIQEVVSIKNYVLEYNTSYSNYDVKTSRHDGTNEYVDVCINGKSCLQDDSTELLKTYLESSEYITNKKRFECVDIKISNITGKVYKITFKF